MSSSLIRRIAARVELPLDSGDENVIRLACNLAVRAGASVQALAYETNVLSPQSSLADDSFPAAKVQLEAWGKELGAPITVHGRTNYADGVGETFGTLLQLCDIGILGVPAQQTPAFRMIANAAIFNGGPVIFLPPSTAPNVSFSRIVVAWKPGGASSRALKAAIALADSDTQVVIVQVEETSTSNIDEVGIEATHFAAAHGVRAEFRVVPARGHSAFSALDAAADELGANLLVSGAVHHGPFHQSLFGSVTKDLMDAGFQRPTLLAG